MTKSTAIRSVPAKAKALPLKRYERSRLSFACGSCRNRLSEKETEDLLLMVYLVLHASGKLAAEKDYPPVSAAWFVELGLDRAFRELLLEKEQGEDAAEAALLLKLMLRWQTFFAEWDAKAASARFILLCADPAAREWLGVHTYQEVEWFARERFELLMEQLLSAEELRVAGAATDAETLSSVLALPRKERMHLKAVAAEAGYRLDRFLALLKASDQLSETKGSD